MKKNKVTMSSMFNAIASGYDKANTFMSLGLDRYWRRELINKIHKDESLKILDIATGTGEIPKLILKERPKSKVYGIDISEEMILIAKKKTPATYILSSAEELPFSDNSFDYALCSYTLRNIEDLNILLKEVKRVLKPSGSFIALDLTVPKHPIFRLFHRIYIDKIIPFIGRFISNNKAAYSYLSNSIKSFGCGKNVVQAMQYNNFSEINTKRLSFGSATIFLARKPL